VVDGAGELVGNIPVGSIDGAELMVGGVVGTPVMVGEDEAVGINV